MELDVQLCLGERDDARIFATITLVPLREELSLHGAVVQLFDAEGESLSSKLLLPVSGTLLGPVSSHIEVRSLRGEIPPGSEVVVTAWWPDGQLQARQSTDPGTSLQAHVLGFAPVPPTDEEPLLELLSEERDRMVQLFPWLVKPPAATIALDAEPELDDLGLDGDDADWLRDLMDE